MRGVGCSAGHGWLGTLLAAAICFPAPAAAQSIGGRVDEHVDQELEGRPGKKKKKKKRKKRPTQSGPRHRSAGAGPAAAETEPEPSEPEPEPRGPKIPRRVLGGTFQLDPQLSIGYRGWRPQDFPSIDVSTENALTWSVGTRIKLGFLSVHRAAYESNGLAAPRRSEASTATRAASATPVAAWLLGVVGFPVDWVLEPIIRYEARAFESTLTPKQPIRVIPRSASQDQDLSLFPATTEQLTMTSTFETLVIGLMYHHDNDPSGIITTRAGSLPRLYFGVGLAQYAKPYMVRVGDAVLDDLLFDARLRGAGLALGLETVQKPERFFVELSTQIGIGEVSLMKDFTVNETLPDGWLIGYAQGELTAGYLHPLLRTRPSLLGGLAASIGGATFYYFQPVSSDEDVRIPPANWDLLWGLRAFLVLPL
jgi:hypothetical protein